VISKKLQSQAQRGTMNDKNVVCIDGAEIWLETKRSFLLADNNQWIKNTAKDFFTLKSREL